MFKCPYDLITKTSCVALSDKEDEDKWLFVGEEGTAHFTILFECELNKILKRNFDVYCGQGYTCI